MNTSKSVSYPETAHDTLYNLEENSFWFRQRNNLLTYIVGRFAKSGVFADVGGGNGFVSYKLQKKIPKLEFILVEPGKHGCENARARGHKKIFNKTIGDLHEYQSLDNIGLFDVIEHIPDDLDFFKVNYAKLSSDGRVFLTVPAYQFLWSQEDISAGHFRRYTITSLLDCASKAGFKVEYSSYFFISLMPLIFLFRAIPYRLGLNKKIQTQEDHAQSFLTSVIEKMLSIEIWLIKKGARFPFGASFVVCLVKRDSEAK